MYECLMGDAVRILWSPSRCSLATLGLYGVISHMVTRRRNEIGVRIPLGADRGRVVRIAILEAVLLAVGLGIGAMLALWAGRAATTLVFGLRPYDAVTMIGAIALLTGFVID
jgi:putative ABC transport system permease protein